MKILLVEDNVNDTLLLKEYLKRSNESYELTDVTTIVKAQQLAEMYFDVILLDLFLPDSSGLDSFHLINKTFPKTPIIVLSGLTDAKVAVEAIGLGAQDYITKGDFNERLLFRALQYAIERKRNQDKIRATNERYELLAKASGEAVWEVELETSIMLHKNSGINEMFGYSPEDVKPSTFWWYQKVHEEDRAALKTAIATAFNEKAESFCFETRFRCNDGSYKFTFNRACIIYENKQPVRLVGSTQNIHELRIAQQELQQKELRHQQAITENTIQVQETERGELGRELHDNINQLLASSKICLETAMKNNETQEKMLPLAFKNLSLAIEDIRKLCKRLVPPSLEDIGFDEAINEMLAPIEESNSIRFRKKISIVSAPPAIQLMLFRIIQEQVHNILKYANATDVLIKVKQTETALQVEISDNGIGFNVKKKAKGIGLSNIKSRTELHGGKVKITSSPGFGCILQLTIPLVNPLPNNHRYETNVHYHH